MKVMTRARTKAMSDTQKQAQETVKDAQKQARKTIKEARKEARQRMIRARIAAARVRAEARTKASGVSAKAVGAAGAAVLVLGYFLGKAWAAKSKARPEEPAANDQTLADRVKSEIFQPEDAPKGSVNVNVEDGVVYLRGEVKRPEQIRKLAEEAGGIDGVRGVENLLHT